MIEIVYTDRFKKDLKQLSKRFRLIRQDLDSLIESLYENPKSGTLLGNDCYKIRLQNSSIPTGKSGGFRVITYYVVKNDRIYLMDIYSKTDQDSISDEEILEILKDIQE